MMIFVKKDLVKKFDRLLTLELQSSHFNFLLTFVCSLNIVIFILQAYENY